MRLEPVPADVVDAKQILSVLLALKKGNFTARMPIDQTGMAGKIADALNDVIDINEKLCAELAHISRVVGKEGKTTQRATIGTTVGHGQPPSIP